MSTPPDYERILRLPILHQPARIEVQVQNEDVLLIPIVTECPNRTQRERLNAYFNQGTIIKHTYAPIVKRLSSHVAENLNCMRGVSDNELEIINVCEAENYTTADSNSFPTNQIETRVTSTCS